jgi:hypothetical protein
LTGAGVSIAASGSAPMASWRGLLDDGIRRCVDVAGVSEQWARLQHEELEIGDIESWLSVAEQITRRLGGRRGGEFRRWLRETVGLLRLDARGRGVADALVSLGTPLATTNYDDLIDTAAGVDPVSWREGARVQAIVRGDDTGVVHLHGHWRDPESVVLGVRSYGAVVGDAAAQATLQGLATLRTLVLVGFGSGLADPNFSALRTWMAVAWSGSEYRHYRLICASERDAFADMHDPDERVLPIVYGHDHADLEGFLRDLAPDASRAPRRGIRSADDVSAIVVRLATEWADRVGLDTWARLTSGLFVGEIPTFDQRLLARLQDTQSWLRARLWPPGTAAFAASMRNYERTLNDLLLVLRRHLELEDTTWRIPRFADAGAGGASPGSEQISFKRHRALVRDLFAELTRASNLVCDRVRDHHDPHFGVEQGAAGLFAASDGAFVVTRYSPAEGLKEQTYPGLDGFGAIVGSRDLAFGGMPGEAPASSAPQRGRARERRAFGPDPDPPLGSGPLPDRVDLRRPWHAIVDQGRTASSVGWAIADSVVRWHLVEGGGLNPDVRLSGRFVWMAAKEFGQRRNYPHTFMEESGTSVKSGLEIARRFGLALESEFPWEARGVKGSPERFYASLSERRIKAYYDLGDDSIADRRPFLDRWRRWMHERGPVLVLLKVDRSLARPADLVRDFDEASVTGSHPAALFGYGPGYILVRSTWGTDWGEHGYARFSPDYAAEAIIESFGIVV